MVLAIKEQVVIKPGGVIEIRRPDLPAGAHAEVTVRIEQSDSGKMPAPSPLVSLIGSCRGTYGPTPQDADQYLRELRDEWDR